MLLLVIRLLVETTFGLASIVALLQRFPSLVLGFLGMPRLYKPEDLQRFHAVLLGADALWVFIFLAIGILCFIDIFRIVGTLRRNHSMV